MEGACRFISRYAELARSMYEQTGRENLREVAEICKKLAVSPAQTYQEAVQAVWFLYVILQMEGNASSFSPGRMDQYLYPYFTHSRAHGMTLEDALEITECLWLKFNQLVYLRNSNSAKYFAGFPIGFNVAIGGQKLDGSDASNELSYLFLQAQAHLLLPQPNPLCAFITARRRSFWMRPPASLPWAAVCRRSSTTRRSFPRWRRTASTTRTLSTMRSWAAWN